MRLVTWNVNSIRARRERVLSWLASQSPDVLCLQETKVTDDNFPYAPIGELGYHVYTSGQRTYNGVAILSREPLEDIHTTLDDVEPQPPARFISGRWGRWSVVNVYVPNGGEMGSDKAAYKLSWLQRLRGYLERNHDPAEPVVVCGDFNVAPDDKDVARPDEWCAGVLCHPQMRAALQELTAWGLVDVFRRVHPEGGIYSWWDYQMLAFPKNNGLRIDLILATEAAAQHVRDAWVHRDERKGKKPSDHAPVVVDVE